MQTFSFLLPLIFFIKSALPSPCILHVFIDNYQEREKQEKNPDTLQFLLVQKQTLVNFPSCKCCWSLAHVAVFEIIESIYKIIYLFEQTFITLSWKECITMLQRLHIIKNCVASALKNCKQTTPGSFWVKPSNSEMFHQFRLQYLKPQHSRIFFGLKNGHLKKKEE